MPKKGKSIPIVKEMWKDGKKYCKRCGDWFDLDHYKIVKYTSGKFKGGDIQYMCISKDLRNSPDYMPVKGKSQIPYEKGTKEYSRVVSLMSNYRMTEQDYRDMFSSQNGCCKICKRPQELFSKNLFVDHCHKTGQVRGLLCLKCNNFLGYACDSENILQEGINYLKEAKINFSNSLIINK